MRGNMAKRATIGIILLAAIALGCGDVIDADENYLKKAVGGGDSLSRYYFPLKAGNEWNIANYCESSPTDTAFYAVKVLSENKRGDTSLYTLKKGVFTNANYEIEYVASVGSKIVKYRTERYGDFGELTGSTVYSPYYLLFDSGLNTESPFETVGYTEIELDAAGAKISETDHSREIRLVDDDYKLDAAISAERYYFYTETLDGAVERKTYYGKDVGLVLTVDPDGCSHELVYYSYI